MVYAVISDVHSNLEALIAVLEDLRNRNISDIFFIGDAVGYGPNPNECIALLKEKCRFLLAGNHEWGVAGLMDVHRFNESAEAAILWTRSVISQANLNAIKLFPIKEVLKRENITLVHAAPYEPEEWQYILRFEDALFNFDYFDTKLCFIGHSHRPAIIEKPLSGELLSQKNKISCNPESRYIINTGSVGQPRDGNPMASYVVVKEADVEIVRVAYDFRVTQKKMSEAGLPHMLIERLAFGM